jgi:hypothetical protein
MDVRPGDPAPSASFEADEVVALIIEMIDPATRESGDEAARHLWMLFASLRPVIDHLFLRALPHIDASEIVRTRDRLMKAVTIRAAGAAIETLVAGGSATEVTDHFRRHASDQFAELITTLVSDVVSSELHQVGLLTDAPDPIETAGSDRISTVTLALALLSGADRADERFTSWRAPARLSRSATLRVVDEIGVGAFLRRIRAFGRGLTALHAIGPSRRARAMLKAPKRGAEQRLSRPGPGFLELHDIAELFGTSETAEGPRISRTLKHVLNAQADQDGHVMRVEHPQLVSLTWVMAQRQE